MFYKTDYHIHSTFSDGKSEPEGYLDDAIRAGMREIGFSEHLNLFVPDQEWCMDPERTHEYIHHIRKLSSRRKDIQIRVGFEVDFFEGREREIYDFIGSLDLDYVIGSVHYMGDTTVDSSPEFFTGKNIDDIFRSYFELLFQAVGSGLFDIIGHCDLLRIYNHVPSFDPGYLYRELARRMSRHDVAFEINTNGRNRPLADFYPDRRFIRLFREENVAVCVNSDSHFPSRIGQYFDEAYRLLRDAGYTEMCVFRKRERFMVPADFQNL
jgi:histidinol-phosphatase (PHP family)